MKTLVVSGLLCMLPIFALADGFTERMPLLAQAKAAGQEPDAKTTKSIDETAESEKKVLDFVAKHQPDLLKLLTFLRQRQPAQFQQALKEMSRSQQRLEGLSKRDSELHAIELRLWQTQSQMRLLAAEISVADSAQHTGELEKKLEQLVGEELDQQVARLRLLKTRTEKELQRLDRQVSELTAGREEQVAKGVKLWQNRIARQARVKKPSSKKQ